MPAYGIADSLHRLAKQLIDSGAAASVEEALALLQGYRVTFSIDAAGALDANNQGALLTGVALARRVFLGGVTVVGDLDIPLTAPLPLGTTLQAAVARLGAATARDPRANEPTIFIGGPPQRRAPGFRMRVTFAGWRGGVVPAHADGLPAGEPAMPLAAMLAAALAVSEAFFHVDGHTPVAGRRAIGLSLWNLAQTDWMAPDCASPIAYLPSRLWLIGLGHLGQAYLWALGLLPYPEMHRPSLVLQDIDVITPSTESTSILSDASLVGTQKTRAMAAWAGQRGFDAAIYERRFDLSFHRTEEEPAVALCGLDNALGRQALDQVGFRYVIEAGLGRGFRDFRTIRLHTLPSTRQAADIWKRVAAGAAETEARPAYGKLLEAGTLDRCGVTTLAGKAVGAPFVGSIAACLAVSEILRLLHGGPLNRLIDLDLNSLDHRTVVARDDDLAAFNPGFVPTTAAPAADDREGQPARLGAGAR